VGYCLITSIDLLKDKFLLPSQTDWAFCLSSPPALPEGEADGGQVERQKPKNPLNPACPVGMKYRTGVNPV
jgi:hypothetical protein